MKPEVYIDDRNSLSSPSDVTHLRTRDLGPGTIDSNPSLSVDHSNGKVLLHCHADCETEEILNALNLNIADLFDGTPKARVKPIRPKESKIVATYQYTSTRRKVRIEPGYNGKSKIFEWQKPGASEGIWVKCRDGEGNPEVLYDLDLVKQSDEVHICEGEKAADRITKEGLTGTCAPTPKWLDSYTNELRGCEVTKG
ncbi:MAG: hypothetical protein GY792_36370 [Gammaproteobacteria bacterium]|nr:hypothetical protein [Gammaproteobacteria bacterium]